MKFLQGNALCSFIGTATVLVALLLSSCADTDDENGGATKPSCTFSESDACDFVLNPLCADEYEWGFSTISECRDIISVFEESDSPCDALVANCLNSMLKYGTPNSDSCSVTDPKSCDDAWNDWNGCLALAESGDC
ncbi:MAG: hypothetical protein IT350_15310 [Deltaproteobacteria bacterium]|nr:hypothetical protein [Deltaproteobacteria bacterium]